MQQVSDVQPDTIKFRLLNINIDKDYNFLRLYRLFAKYNMKYDAKLNMYTMKLQPLFDD
jgi:hypothetical protein